jgi:predicted dehydrogenase
MIRVGIAGIGFMGWIHYLALKRIPNAKLQAIATRDAVKRGGDWRSIRGNFGPPGEIVDLKDVTTHSTIEELVADPNVDLVDFCLPSDRHADSAIRALEAGKHVLVEKPIALSLADADRMVAAAKKATRLLMVAHVLPFFPDFGFLAKAVASGAHGKLVAAHFRRHISPPDWSDAFASVEKTGGPAIDLHIHDAHFVRLIAGMPNAVHSIGRINEGRVDYIATNYLYSDGPVISATSGACSVGGRPFTHGYEAYFENATLYYEAGGPLIVFNDEGRNEPELAAADPVDSFVLELGDALTAVQLGTAPDLLAGALARDALALCLAEQESARSGKMVAVAS